MFHQVFAGLQALLVFWIGIFALQIVKIPILSWVQGPETVLAASFFTDSFGAHSSLSLANPFLPSTQKVALVADSLPGRWVLKGTLLLGEEAKAILEDPMTGEQQMLAVGETLGATEVLEIDRNEVVLEQAGKKVTLVLNESLRRQSGPTRVASKQVISKEAVSNPHQEVKVKKRALENLIQKMPELVRSAELILFQGSPPLPNGYLISVGPQMMMMDPMGLEDGDVIKRVDGTELDSEKTLFEVFNMLQSKKQIEVEVNRDDKDMVITYHVES